MDLRMMIKKVKSRINEIDDTFVTPDNIIDFINDAQRDLTDVLRLEAEAEIDLVDGQEWYDLPEDLNKMERVEVDGFRYLQRSKTHYLANKQKYFSEKKVYAFWDRRIYLYPTPDDEAEKLNLWYYRRPEELEVDSDVPEIDEKYHRLLVDYAIAMCFEKDEEQGLFNQLMGRYEIKKQEMFMNTDVINEDTSVIAKRWAW